MFARLWRSTGPGAGQPERSTGRAQECALGRVSWPVDRAVDRLKATHSRVGPVDRTVDRPESCCSLVLGAVDRAVDRQAQRQIFDRWPVDRKVNFDLSASQRADLVGAYIYTPFESWFLTSFSRAKIHIFLSVLTTSFKRVLGSKISTLFIF